MSVESILAPVFVQVALIFVLMFYTFGVRTAALRRRDVRIADIVLGQQNWPPRATQVGNAYNNQFQLPLLFFVLVILAYMLKKADLLFVLMSWIFVISRILHAFIHVTTNRLQTRFMIFAVGAIVLLIMWIIFALRVLLVF
jgi:hypothetical protein